MLKLVGVSKAYQHGGGPLNVLQDINMDVPEGEFLCVVGPSGCGKTTLLNLIAGLERPDTGTILQEGRPVVEPGPDRLMIFQELGLFPWLTVRENVEFGLRLRGVEREERRERTRRQLEMVNLGRFRDFRVHELSGGMKQRVALARALIMDPHVLLMDEPFTALDALTRDVLHDELQRLWLTTGKTIVFVTHNVREAVCLGDRVVVFSANPGQIRTVFPINLPRPRHIEDHGLMEVVRLVLAELSVEVERTARAKREEGAR